MTLVRGAALKPVCTICNGESPITGDGPAVCKPCVLSLGRIAGDPMHADTERVVELATAHADVVELKPCEAHGGCWAWTGWSAA